jgi:hypothetical protein
VGAAAGALVLALTCEPSIDAQSKASQPYGGQAPWGMERPVTIHGEVRRGEAFEQAIGRGLSFRLAPTDAGWRIEVGDGKDDFTRCATGPFHGLTAMDIEGDANRDVDSGGTRWFDFVLTTGDQERQCTAIDEALHDVDRSRNTDEDLSTKPREKSRITGRGWLKIARMDGDFESMTFDAELTLYGALRLWQRPSRYIIPAGHTGWIGVSADAPSAPPAPLAGGYYQLRIPASGFLRTSTELRADQRDAQYVFSGGGPIPSAGPQKKIWGAYRVLEGRCGRYLMFFVGTKQQYQRARVAGPPSNIRCD